MFLSKMFLNSLKSFPKMFEMRSYNLVKVLIYFIILNLILSFPMNLNLVQNKGIKLEKFGLDLKTDVPDWFPSGLPQDCRVSDQKLVCTSTELFVNQYNNFEFVVNPKGDYQPTGDALIFKTDSIAFIKNSNQQNFDYEGFNTGFSFGQLSTLDKTDAVNLLVQNIEIKFTLSTILFGILLNTGTNILMNTIFLLVVSMIAMLFKVGRKKFPSYLDIFKLFVYCMTWPSLICLMIGLAGVYAFIPVVFQFGTPLIFLLLFYRILKNIY